MKSIRHALVTGASSGIGQGIALVLAEQGYDLAITYGRNREGGQDTQRQIQALGRRCFLYEAHLEQPGVAEAIVRRAHGDLGGLSLLVSNAARDTRNSILTATREDLDYLIGSNFYAYLLGAGQAARLMVRDGIPGSLVFITSTRGESAHPDDFLYGGLKAAINRAAASMALDLSPYGIRVHCIAPGATQVRDAAPLPPDFQPGDPVDGRPYYPLERYIPLGRMGTPRENGELVAFLASEKGSYITGQVIRVDGGLTLPGMAEGTAPTHWISPEWTARQRADMEKLP